MASQNEQIKQLMATLQKQADLIDKQSAQLNQLLQQHLQPGTTATATGTGTISDAYTLQIVKNALDTFHYDPSSDATFDAWYKKHEPVFTQEASSLNDEKKIGALLSKLELSVHKRLHDYMGSVDPKTKKFQEVVDILTDLFGNKVTIFTERYNFGRIKRKPQEDIMDYFARVNGASTRIDYGNMELGHYAAIVFVSGLSEQGPKDLQKKLLDKLQDAPNTKLTDLEKEITVHRNQKLNERTISAANPLTNSVETQAVQQRGRQPDKSKAPYRPRSKSVRRTNRVPEAVQAEAAAKKPCASCGKTDHSREDCRFKNYTCHFCNKQGHIQSACRKRSRAQSTHDRRASASSSIQVGHVTIQATTDVERRRFIQVEIDGNSCEMQVDSGSDRTIVPEQFWKQQLKEFPLSSTSFRAINASGKPLHIIGERKCKIRALGQTAECTLYVAEDVRSPLYGTD